MENIKIRLQFIEYILRDIKNYNKQEESIYKKVIKEKIVLILSSSFITELKEREIYYNIFAISLYKIAMYEYYLNISTKSEKTAIYNKIEDSLINDHNKLCELITDIKDYENDEDILKKLNNLYINI